MALPTNIPTGINATTTPGQYWTDEDGVSHYTGDVYSYADQSGNQVNYTPPPLSVAQDDSGTGGGIETGPARWTRAVLDPNAEDGYTYSPYLEPAQQAQKDMYGGAMNPQDASFFPQLQNIIQQTVGGQYSQDQILAAMMASNWWGKLGGGSNAYNAAKEVADRLGANTSWYNQGTSDQYRQAAEAISPEGRARAQPHGGLLGEGGFLGLGSSALPIQVALAMASMGASEAAGAGLDTSGFSAYDANAFTPPPVDIDYANAGYDNPYVSPDASGALPPVTTPPLPDSPLSLPSDVPVPGSSFSLNNNIYQPVLQTLTDAGVPWQIVQALPSVINSSLKGGVLSKLMGGSFLTGAELGAIGSTISNLLESNGFPASPSLIKMLTNMLGKQFDMFGSGGGGGGGGGTSQSPLSSVRAGNPNIPWLDSKAEFLAGSPLGAKEKDEVKLEPLTAKNGGLIMKKYASGGLGAISCLNQNPAYMPQFVCSGPDVLPNSVATPKRQALTMSKLKQMRQQISPYGEMGGLAEGGLPKKYAEAAPKGHDPEFITGLTGYYACGGGTGQSDDIPAMLHDGDYVMDADVVSALGDGSSKAGMGILEGFRKQVPHKEESGGKAVAAKIADGEYVFPAGFVNALGGGDNKKGAKILDGLREKLRMHKRSAPTGKIPPKAKSPLDYIAKG